MNEKNSKVASNVSEVNQAEEKLQQKVELTVGDLKVMVNIIEVVTARGGFRAPELKGIGEYFEKVSALIPTEETPSSQ